MQFLKNDHDKSKSSILKLKDVNRRIFFKPDVKKIYSKTKIKFDTE